MTIPSRLALAALVLVLPASAAMAATSYKIVTGPDRSTYHRVGQDLARHVAPSSDIDLQVVATPGSVDNLKRLRSETGVKFALVQADVLQSYVDLAASGNRVAAELIRRTRVIAPLFQEEIHFVVRADAPWTFVHEIRDARINAGELGSGSALTVTNLYRLLFAAPMPEAKTLHLSNERALVQLVTDKSVDVVAIVSGQPERLLADVRPEARQHVKLLKVDPEHPTTKAALRSYGQATLRTQSYPNLLTDALPVIAVKAFLVTFEFDRRYTETSMRKFAQALCANLPALREKGHPKWREVDLSLPDLGKGWSYYSVTARELRECGTRQGAKAPVPAAATASTKGCDKSERVLGLCGKR